MNEQEKELCKILQSFETEVKSIEIVDTYHLAESCYIYVINIDYGQYIMTKVPMIHWDGEQFLITPWDWQDPTLEDINAKNAEQWDWRYNDTEHMPIWLNGAPRFLM